MYFRKGQVYEGGIRVPGIIEWPKGVPDPIVSDLNACTCDLLPTICDLLGLPLPARPLDGISLKPLIEGGMTSRPRPICFWDFDTSQEGKEKPYIDPELQKGTTPLVKKMDGRLTRNFRNVHHPEIKDDDFSGPRAILDNRFKLVVHDRRGTVSKKELFDIRNDPAEEQNLVDEQPGVAGQLEEKLRDWRESVLKSLAGADYQ